MMEMPGNCPAVASAIALIAWKYAPPVLFMRWFISASAGHSKYPPSISLMSREVICGLDCSTRRTWAMSSATRSVLLQHGCDPSVVSMATSLHGQTVADGSVRLGAVRFRQTNHSGFAAASAGQGVVRCTIGQPAVVSRLYTVALKPGGKVGASTGPTGAGA